MELLQLKYFMEAAELENFSKVAERHLLPQSAISHTIARLEKELGCKLFDRKGKHVVLNQKGKNFYKRVSFAMWSLDDGVREVKRSINIVRVKCYTAARHMPPIIKRFTEDNPNIDVLIRQVYPNDENYDILISSSYYRDDETSIEMPLLDEEILVAVSREHRFADRDSISLTELKNEKIITVGVAEKSTFFRTVEAHCAMLGFGLKVGVDTQDTFTAESYTEQNFGVMFVPKITWAMNEREALKYLRINDIECKRRISAFIRKEVASDEIVRRVADYIADSFRSLAEKS